MFDNEWGFADDASEEFFFGDLFEVGEAEFGEQFLSRCGGLAVTNLFKNNCGGKSEGSAQ